MFLTWMDVEEYSWLNWYVRVDAFRHAVRNPIWFLMAYSDRTYVGTGPGPEWVTVYYVKPSHCNLYGNLNRSYTLALYQSRSQSHSHTSSVWISHKCSISFIWKWAFFSQITLAIHDYPIHNSIVSSKLLSCKNSYLSNLDQQILSAMKCDLDIWWNCIWKLLYQYRYGLRLGISWCNVPIN